MDKVKVFAVSYNSKDYYGNLDNGMECFLDIKEARKDYNDSIEDTMEAWIQDEVTEASLNLFYMLVNKNSLPKDLTSGNLVTVVDALLGDHKKITSLESTTLKEYAKKTMPLSEVELNTLAKLNTYWEESGHFVKDLGTHPDGRFKLINKEDPKEELDFYGTLHQVGIDLIDRRENDAFNAPDPGEEKFIEEIKTFVNTIPKELSWTNTIPQNQKSKTIK